MTDAREMPEWPERIVRDGPYKVYKGHKYTVYDDDNSAETPYQADLAEAALARLRVVTSVLVQCYTYFAHLQNHTEASELLHDRLYEAISTIGDLPDA